MKNDVAVLKMGFQHGLAAAREETVIGATFRGSAGSLRHRQGGDGYGKDVYAIGYRAGYSAHMERVKILKCSIETHSVVCEVVMENGHDEEND
jgi:hypothetical protein